eukprot:TRINITY_DN11995_c0_g1_i1.p1 TRINITY_DN11995_c0_g1~~TRINITY_DN11995_c0_g1_i1.p1  ORF type:complete len:250 (-),score=37.02 TRINITY_DN11995_c0_g1_i1:38-787(-)
MRHLYKDAPKESKYLSTADIKGAQPRKWTEKRHIANAEPTLTKSVENVSFKMRSPFFADFDYSKPLQIEKNSLTPVASSNLKQISSARNLLAPVGSDSLDYFQKEYTAKVSARSEAEGQQYNQSISSEFQKKVIPGKEEWRKRLFEDQSPINVHQSQELPPKKTLFIRSPLSSEPLVKYEVSAPQNLQLISRLEDIHRNNQLETNARYSKAKNVFYGEEDEIEKLKRRKDPLSSAFSCLLYTSPSPRDS